MADPSKLQDTLNIHFKNTDLLKQAFIHRSYLNENTNVGLPHNERMEFLGDAVLELVVTEHLYQNYPNSEGDLTNWRAALVNSKNLSQVAERIGFNDFLLLSKGELRDTGKARQYILANTMESFIGALYLDKGYLAAHEFITTHILEDLPKILADRSYIDPKSRLQELAQEHTGFTPSYQVLEESGPDHDKRFVVGIFVAKDQLAKGEGSSKQEAEEDAATHALEKSAW